MSAASGRPAIVATSTNPVSGFVYEPAAERVSGTAVLICAPFGWAEICSYRALRSWALSLADAGHWAARFDLPSSGDSAGHPRDPGRLEAWIEAVTGTAAWLRECSGASRVTAIGLELGGVLACCAAARGAPIDDLVLWAVPSRGARLLRELRVSGTLLAATYPEDDRPGSQPDGDLQLTGYLLTAETASALESVRLTSLEPPAAAQRRVLLLERDGQDVDERLKAHFAGAGAAVTVANGPGYADMMIHPQQAVPPLETIAATVAWIGDGAKAPGPAAATEAPEAPAELEVLELTEPDGTVVHETPVRLRTEGGELFGVLSSTQAAADAPLCVVLLNGGVVRRIGPNRTWVEIARRWAARGVPVVRIDLEGIGDSDGELDRPLPDAGLYRSQQTAQTLSILDQLRERGLPDRFVLAGLCSGAYWGLHAALEDTRVSALFALNLYCFFWDDEVVLERDRRASMAALRSGFVKRVLAGRVRADLVRRGVRSLLAHRPGARGTSAEERQTPQNEAALDQLRDQGTRVMFLFGNDEPLYGQLERTGTLERFDRWPNATIERIPSRDHMFHQFWLQDDVHATLDRALDEALAVAHSG